MTPPDLDRHVLIVGAGHAGGTLAALLRQNGWTGRITLAGEEAVAPYQRPPLSKTYLKRDTDVEALKLKPDEFYPEQDIALMLGMRIESVNRAAKTVGFGAGGTLPYDVLVLATGSQARRLPIPGAELKGVHELRTVADAEALEAAVAPGRRLAVVGAGYVGLEVAASARLLGMEVVVLEREARVLARVAAEPLSRFFETLHRGHGAEILTGVGVSAFVGDEDGFIRAVVLGDGREVACDAALVGVGAAACEDLALGSGLECRNGVVVDELGRTSDPSVFAIGDCTQRPLPVYGGRMFRLESVPNALEQARQVAALLCGKPAPAPETPWFWSDQYDVKLQIAGVPFDADRLVVRGEPSEGRFAVFHLAGDRIMAVEAVNAPPEFMMGKMLIQQGRAVDPDKLADTAVPMKAVAL